MPSGALDVSLPQSVLQARQPHSLPSQGLVPVMATELATLPPPPPLGLLKIGSISFDADVARCPAKCNALARTELHGGVVKWGADHLVPDAAACCAACQATPKCSVWVYCGNAKTCGARHKQCWLKQTKGSVWDDHTLLVGTNELWTAGTSEPAPPDHPSGAGRQPPAAGSADIALVFGGITIRFRLRAAATPRAAATIRAVAAAHAAAAATTDGATAAAMARGTSECGAAILGASLVPVGYGSADLPDGIGSQQRWPRGAGMIRGTLWAPNSHPPGAGAAGGDGSTLANNGPHTFSPIEASPVGVMRGSLAWAVPGGDGPTFFIALADMPHLGVSIEVFGEVVREDLPALDAFARGVEARQQRLPMALSVKGVSHLTV